MKIIDGEKLKLQDYEILQMKEYGATVLKKGNLILKLFDKNRIASLSNYGIDLEKKILNADNIHLNYIALPTGIIYDNNGFAGYTMNRVSDFDYSVVLSNDMSLYDYAKLYKKFEEILDDATNNGIIITDFANPKNIFFRHKNNIYDDIVCIDYDDMQVGDIKTSTYSSNIDSVLKDTVKYNKDGLYTSELNKLSLIYFYFNDVFDCCLRKLEYDMENIYVNFLSRCHVLGLTDKYIIDELAKIYKQKERNPHLSELFFEIASLYELNFDEDDERVLVRK